GNLEFLGRRDHQVKIRGFRIELGEVEAALLAEPQVGEAVVALRGDQAGEPRLVAYLTLRLEGGGDAAPVAVERELRRALAARLPAPMVPSAYVVLEALPRLPSGKVDRRALPAPVEVTAGARGLATPTEELLAGIWAEVLGR